VDEPAVDNREHGGFFFPVFVADVVTGELHLLMEELLSCCSRSGQVRATEEEDRVVTARRLEQRMDAPLGLVTMFLFQFVAIWNNFFLPMIMLRSEDLFPVVFGLYNWNNQLNQLPELRGLVLIGAVRSVIPLIVTFLLLQRFWRNGLGAGALK
jgi:hypothetical protein